MPKGLIPNMFYFNLLLISFKYDFEYLETVQLISCSRLLSPISSVLYVVCGKIRQWFDFDDYANKTDTFCQMLTHFPGDTRSLPAAVS